MDHEDARSEVDQVVEHAQSKSCIKDINRATEKRKLCSLANTLHLMLLHSSFCIIFSILEKRDSYR